MNAIRYFSKTGNTQKLAELLGDQLNLEPATIATPLPEHVTTLLLGGAVHMASVDTELKQYIATLQPDQIDQVVLFGTSGAFLTVEKGLRKLLKQQGLSVAPKGLFIHGMAPHAPKFSAEKQATIAQFAKTI
jgi:flavodoxin